MERLQHLPLLGVPCHRGRNFCPRPVMPPGLAAWLPVAISTGGERRGLPALAPAGPPAAALFCSLFRVSAGPHRPGGICTLATSFPNQPLEKQTDDIILCRWRDFSSCSGLFCPPVPYKRTTPEFAPPPLLTGTPPNTSLHFNQPAQKLQRVSLGHVVPLHLPPTHTTLASPVFLLGPLAAQVFSHCWRPLP